MIFQSSIGIIERLKIIIQRSIGIIQRLKMIIQSSIEMIGVSIECKEVSA